MLIYRYHEAHSWICVDEDGTARVGISEYAQEQLGDVVYVEVPDSGRSVQAGEDIGVIESVKTTGELCAPVAGTILAVNAALGDAPELLNTSPLDDGWIFRMSIGDEAELGDLMTEPDYLEFVQSIET